MVFDLKEGMIVKLRNGNYAVVANLDSTYRLWRIKILLF